ncbi:scavenger mRNA decapping enzyme [Aureobasidium sp. EXF-8845]|nr:scavenger mRNA decapping enzyme [Aureobasidium sp. EXF-8845]KAI4835402.1 scavenger mRNA decapping enzyme [Aureobasidium sp. EXF-8846]
MATSSDADALIPQFKFEKLLNQGIDPRLDQAGRRIVLQGTIADQPALLLAERAAFDANESHLSTFSSSLSHIRNLGDNDIYRWYMAHSGAAQDQPPDLKINLIYPCTEQHLKKYAAQAVRYVTETPDIYRDHVRPYMQAKRDQGRLNWVFNILDGRTEQEDVLFRSPHDTTPEDERYLLLPDLNWDRKTLGSLHLLALVERRDIWSLRDLKKKHVTWLKSIVADIAKNVSRLYGIDEDMLKCYVHYQPTYYHFHIHIVHVSLEAGATQAVGKALSLDNIISQLATMAGDDGAGMDKVDLSFTLGEASELWTDVFLPLKEKRLQ